MNTYFKRFSSSILFSLAAIILLLIAWSNEVSAKPKVLVFSKNTYFFHASIPNGIAAIKKLGAENGFNADTTTNADWFIEDTLKKYAAVIFISTADNKGLLLNQYQEAAFKRYIQKGGGYVGIHAASDAEYDWDWYNKLVGAVFNGHPNKPHIQQAKLHVVDTGHISTKGLPKVWERKDEWYNFKNLNKDVKVLITIDENTYIGGTNGNSHPMSWYHNYDGGRAFYTALGHTEESFTEPLFLKHLLGGIQYAIGQQNN